MKDDALSPVDVYDRLAEMRRLLQSSMAECERRGAKGKRRLEALRHLDRRYAQYLNRCEGEQVACPVEDIVDDLLCTAIRADDRVLRGVYWQEAHSAAANLQVSFHDLCLRHGWDGNAPLTPSRLRPEARWPEPVLEVVSYEELMAPDPDSDAWQTKGLRKCYQCGGEVKGTKGTVFPLADKHGVDRWRLWCDTCYFRPDECGTSVADRNPYWIGLNRLRHWKHYGGWTIHLGKTKRWHDPQSWANIGVALFGRVDM